MIALAIGAAELRERGKLPLAFDRFGDDIDPEAPRYIDHASDDRGRLGVRPNPDGQRRAELDHVDGHADKVAERGKPAPEIVERDAHAGRTQVGDRRKRDIVLEAEVRSEARRCGKEGVSKCSIRWWP